ncbi:MAG: hypothetical protein F4Z48_07485, partial [Dehalococcoidia bacterium]|nr:hypothetical protein [Dehalococcoidia bacterium]
PSPARTAGHARSGASPARTSRRRTTRPPPPPRSPPPPGPPPAPAAPRVAGPRASPAHGRRLRAPGLLLRTLPQRAREAGSRGPRIIRACGGFPCRMSSSSATIA